jgi:hypothetical protein
MAQPAGGGDRLRGIRKLSANDGHALALIAWKAIKEPGSIPESTRRHGCMKRSYCGASPEPICIAGDNGGGAGFSATGDLSNSFEGAARAARHRFGA